MYWHTYVATYSNFTAGQYILMIYDTACMLEYIDSIESSACVSVTIWTPTSTACQGIARYGMWLHWKVRISYLYKQIHFMCSIMHAGFRLYIHCCCIQYYYIVWRVDVMTYIQPLLYLCLEASYIYCTIFDVKFPLENCIYKEPTWLPIYSQFAISVDEQV